MNYPISRPMPLKTEFLVSCYNTPSATVRRLFYVVCVRVIFGQRLTTALIEIICRDTICCFACQEVVLFFPVTAGSRWKPTRWPGFPVIIPMPTGPIRPIPGSCFGSNRWSRDRGDMQHSIGASVSCFRRFSGGFFASGVSQDSPSDDPPPVGLGSILF